MTTLVQFPDEVMERLKNAALGRQGRIPFLVPQPPITDGACENCGGFENVFVDWITGGPYSAPTKPNETFTVYNEEWYSYKRTGYPCPLCQDSVKVARASLKDTGLVDGEMGLSLD